MRSLVRRVERHVETQDIDARFAEQPKLTLLRILGNKVADFRLIQLPRFGHALDLVLRSGGTDFRIQAATRCSDQVDGNRRNVVGISVLQILDA